MKSIKLDKTNVSRILDQLKVDYKQYQYDSSVALSAVEVSKVLNVNEEKVYKTLVTVGKSNNHYVFVIPSYKELELKKASFAVGEKNIEMVKSKDLLSLTGYIHGGCSPIGMKKIFKTTFDESIKNQESIIFSAGKIGYQVEVNVIDLPKILQHNISDVTKI